jgi:uncharacterized membrane protein (UPF0136 family)|tara:strand:+ start:6525 stop:6866 length:342 start_codon:yes stop_codon:yes gene_type:complete
MKTYQVNLLNSIVLIIIGLWGYFEVVSPTALIPVFFGLVLLLCNGGVKKENKVIAHIVVLLTLLLLVALVGMRLPKSLDSGGLGLIRVIAMISTSTIAMVTFIKSFIANRKNK